MTDSDRPDEPGDERDVSPEDVYEEMEPLEPYTTGELARSLHAPKRLLRSLLRSLSGDGKVREKEPEPNRIIRVRKSPTYECPNCGYEFQIEFLHPVLSSARLCPQCGTQLKR